jgi:hypothetical protein
MNLEITLAWGKCTTPQDFLKAGRQLGLEGCQKKCPKSHNHCHLFE